MVESLRKMLGEALGVVLVRPQGLKVPELEAVRVRLSQAGARMRVVKNTLFNLALRGTPYEQLSGTLKGPVAAVALCEGIGPGLSALLASRGAGRRLEVIGGYLGGRVRSTQEIESLADLPSTEMLAARVVGLLQVPMVNVARALQMPIVQLVASLEAAARKSA